MQHRVLYFVRSITTCPSLPPAVAQWDLERVLLAATGIQRGQGRGDARQA